MQSNLVGLLPSFQIIIIIKLAIILTKFQIIIKLTITPTNAKKNPKNKTNKNI